MVNQEKQADVCPQSACSIHVGELCMNWLGTPHHRRQLCLQLPKPGIQRWKKPVGSFPTVVTDGHTAHPHL